MNKIIILLISLVIITACSHNIPREDGFLEVYFCPGDDCQQAMITFLLNASEVKCAFYDLNLDNLTTTLEEKNAEVLVFEDNFEDYGTSVKSKGLMHDKFCIIDKNTVFTGSFNPTVNGNFKNNNNLIIIESKTLANNYLDEFLEIKEGYSKKTKDKYLLFNNSSIENYFCPEDNCKKEVLEELNSTNESIYFMTFSFTDKDIADLLIEKNKNIDVKGVVEKQRINMNYEIFHYLNNSGVRVFTDKNPAIMHHKVFIIDNETVITGSYNPTKSANEKNDENMLIIHNRDIAKQFLEEFNER